MPKAILPLLASFLICGTATATLIANNARAEQSSHKPVMMLAQNQAAPPADREVGPPRPGMEEGMMRRPQRGQFCQDAYARKAAEIAFLEAKLDLAPAQQPLFARWKDVSMDNAKRHQGECTGGIERTRNGQRPDMMQRLTREEDMLKARVADIEAERPALGALYAALSPDQQQDFGRAARGAREGRMHMAMGMMRGGREMGRREMGRRLGRGGPDGAPPTPPSPPQ